MQLQFQPPVALDGQVAYLACIRIAEESGYTVGIDSVKSSSWEV
jgi:hypothetical protein